MNVMFLVAAKIHLGWHACDQFLGAGTMMLIFNFISIYNVHLLLHIPRIETGAFSLLYLCYVCFLNDVKVVHTDWHVKISGQFYNWIFSFKSALLENVELLSMSKFRRTMVRLTKDVPAEISNHWCDFRRRFSAQRIKNVIFYVLTCCQCTWPYWIRCRHNNADDSLHTDLGGTQWLWFFVWKSMNAGFHLQRYPHRAAITHTSIIGFYTTNATHY